MSHSLAELLVGCGEREGDPLIAVTAEQDVTMGDTAGISAIAGEMGENVVAVGRRTTGRPSKEGANS